MRRHIGAALQEAALDPLLTGREHLRLQASLQGLPHETRRQRADELLHRVGLSEAGDRKVKTYSGGMKRRLDLALALVPFGLSVICSDSFRMLWVEVASVDGSLSQ